MNGYWLRFGFAGGLLITSSLIHSAPANAADAITMVSINDALATPDAKEKLDSSVKFYFGDTSHPPISQNLGSFVTNQKTNGFAKKDSTSCSWVLLSALLEFQKRAIKIGANAVINIHSYYKKNDVSNDTQVECHTGFLMSGIALKGDFVKLESQ